MERQVTAPKNAKEWREVNAQAVADMLNGVRKHPEVKEVTNAFGKQITLTRAQIEYHAERKEKPNIQWLK